MIESIVGQPNRVFILIIICLVKKNDVHVPGLLTIYLNAVTIDIWFRMIIGEMRAESLCGVFRDE